MGAIEKGGRFTRWEKSDVGGTRGDVVHSKKVLLRQSDR